MPYSVGSAIVILGHDFPNQWYAGFNSFREELVTVLTLWLSRMLCSPTKLGVSLKSLVRERASKVGFIAMPRIQSVATVSGRNADYVIRFCSYTIAELLSSLSLSLSTSPSNIS